MKYDPKNLLNAGQSFLSLKWKTLFGISMVLVSINVGFAYLVWLGDVRQFESQQNQKRLTQAREVQAVLSQGIDAMSAFASFVPLLAPPGEMQSGLSESEKLLAVLREHGLMLDLELGVSSVHYFSSDDTTSPVFSWPDGARAPLLRGLLAVEDSDETPQGSLVCSNECAQLLSFPVLRDGHTSGYLVMERQIGESMRNFYRLSGADLAILRHPDPASTGADQVDWLVTTPALTHPSLTLQILNSLAQAVPLDDFGDAPEKVRLKNDWYEVVRIPDVELNEPYLLLGINKITEQITGIREAAKGSLILGLAGILFSELVLLALLWRPMERIQDVVFSLPLFAEKLFVRLKEELPKRTEFVLPPDEIDLMIDALWRVSDQMEALDSAHTQASSALQASEQGLTFAQSLARVASWTGEPISGKFRFADEARKIDPRLAALSTWDELVDLVHPEDRSVLRIAWRRGKAGGSMDIEFRLPATEGVVYIHAVAAFEVVGVARVLQASGMMQDVSETRAAQHALRAHRDELENEVRARTSELIEARNNAQRMAREKSDFLSNMSHEIRTPINAVLGLAQVGLKSSANRKVESTFEQILDSGEHLLNVVNDVLDHAKLEAGMLSVEEHPFKPRVVVGKCVNMLRQRIEMKALHVVIDVKDDCPETLLGDSFRLQQILINLLANAVKFTEDGGVTLTVSRHGGDYHFKVADTGIGMSRDQIGQLFVPFHQCPSSGQARHEGTGLGLSISNRLAGLMGGEIHVRSERGKGSEFVLILPLRAFDKEITSEVSIQNVEGSRLQGLVVLAADDMRVNRTVIESLLEMEGATAETVPGGEDVVSRYQSGKGGHYDLVLMDIEMPGMDGRTATKRLREAGIDVPIVGVSAHASLVERQRSLEAGMNDLLVKPVLLDALVAVALKYTGAKAGKQIRTTPTSGRDAQNTV